MRRSRFLLLVIGGLVASLAIGESTDARPRLPAVFGLLGVPFGLLGHPGHLRAHHAYRYRSTRHVIARGRGHRGVAVAAAAAGGVGAAALASRTAWSGPVFWPTAYDDMFGYVVRPSDLSFWSGGFADVLGGVFGQPGSEERGSARTRSAVVAAADDRTTGAGNSTSEPRPCGTLTARTVDDLMTQISVTVEPKPAQQAAMNELHAALSRAADDLRSACLHVTPLTPLARLDAMQHRLWAMQSAVLSVRAPFAKLVATLDDDQKARLDGSSVTAAPERSADMPNMRRRARHRQDQPNPPNGSNGTPVQICFMQSRAAGAPPSEQIGERVRPNDDQQMGLTTLTETSGNMTKLMLASCPEKRPANALARIDAVLGRLEAMLYAISVVNPPLQNFYSGLTDEQKARFNSLGVASAS